MDIDFGESKGAALFAMVQQVVFNDNLLLKLRATDVLINALEDEARENTEAEKFQKYIHALFADKAFIRRLTYLTTLKQNIETHIEYAGFDYLSNPDFHYDEAFETRSMLIEKKLAEFLGKLLKELNSKGLKVEL